MTQKEQEEKAKKQYANAEAAGLARIAPIAPIAPIDETPVQPVVNNPYTDFIKTLQKPITPEEEARRERAARAVQGVVGLGNLMSAFANLTFTGKGAPSQTLPTQSVDNMGKEMTSWKDKLKAEREKYQAAELSAKAQQWKAELDAQHRAQQQANADRAHEENVRQFNERMAKEEQARKDKLAEDARKQSNWEKEQKAKEEYNKGMLDIYGRRADIQQQDADTRASNANAKTIQKSLSEGKNQIPLRFGDIGGKSPMDVVLDANKLNEASYQQIVNLLDAETKKHYRIDENTKGADLKTKVYRVIGDMLHIGNEDILEYLTQTGALTLKTPYNAKKEWTIGNAENTDNRTDPDDI